MQCDAFCVTTTCVIVANDEQQSNSNFLAEQEQEEQRLNSRLFLMSVVADKYTMYYFCYYDKEQLLLPF